MGAYLIDHPPRVQQFYRTRNKRLTGCTVIHTAESVMDTVGPDTGAESVAEFIRTRTTAGSYHDLVDSDSWLRVVPLESGAFHDGTGSNNWALSLSFACRTSDWRAMSAAKRRAFLRQGALAFADQQRWRKANGFPLTVLRLISKAESDAGQSGFIYHGMRDPGRRTDPGVAAPNLFPLEEFLTECRAALAGTTTATPEEDMPLNAADAEVVNQQTYRGGTNLFIDLASGANPASDDFAGYLTGIVQRATQPLHASIEALAALVAVDRDDISAEQIVATIQKAIADATVKVDVNVAQGKADA